MAPVAGAAPKVRWAGWIVFGIVGLIATGAGTLLPGLTTTDQVNPTTSETPAGEDTFDYTPPPLPDFPSPRAMLLRLALGTVVVLALCVLTLLGVKRWLGPFAQTPAAGRELYVVETLQLNGRCSVFLLQTGKTRALAGVDGSGLKVLIPLNDPFEVGLADDESGAVESSPALSFPKVA